MARTSSVANVTPDEAAGTLLFSFTEAAGGGQVVVNPFDFTEEMQKHSILHGVEQKLRDSYAGKSGSEAREAFDKVLNALSSGRWSTRGEGEGAPVGAFAEAFRRLMIQMGKAPEGWPLEKAKETLNKMDDATKKSIRADKRTVKHLADIAIERATGNADELLAGVEIAA